MKKKIELLGGAKILALTMRAHMTVFIPFRRIFKKNLVFSVKGPALSIFFQIFK
jgi:hypothetical protein